MVNEMLYLVLCGNGLDHRVLLGFGLGDVGLDKRWTDELAGCVRLRLRVARNAGGHRVISVRGWTLGLLCCRLFRLEWKLGMCRARGS